MKNKDFLTPGLTLCSAASTVPPVGQGKVMKIHIEFLRHDETLPRVLELSPEEYFDPLDEGEELSVNSVPKHLEEFTYTGFGAEDLRWAVLDISDGTVFKRIRSQFLDGLKSLMTHSLDSEGREEIIHQTEISPYCWHTVRTLREPGNSWAVVMNNIIKDHPDQPYENLNFCGEWTFDQMKAFGNIGQSPTPG